MITNEQKEYINQLNPLTAKFRNDVKAAVIEAYPSARSVKEAFCLSYLDIKEPPKCKFCDAYCIFWPLAKSYHKAHIAGWNDICSSRDCANLKREDTTEEKYGTRHHLSKGSTSNSLEKRKLTNLETYGVEHVLQNEEIQKKMQENIRQSNNGFHFMQSGSNSGVKEKVLETNRKNNGGVHLFQSEKFMTEIPARRLEETGYAYPSQNPESRTKAINTWIENYEEDNPRKSRKVIDKMLRTRMETTRDSTEHEVAKRFYTTLLDIGEAVALGIELEFIKENNLENSISGISRYTGVPSSLINAILDRNPELKVFVNHNTRMRSFVERDLYQWIHSQDQTTTHSDRKLIYPKELDIFVPSKHVAIEVNGCYFHSDHRGGKDRLYHLDKTDKCNELGIKLFHFTDIDLDKKNAIVKSMLLNALNLTPDKIFARKCKIVNLDNSQVKDFFDSNHINGHSRCKFAYGLIYENELVMVMSFGQVRNGHDKSKEYELIRMAAKLNTLVVGGVQKLWSAFLNDKDPESVLCYQDRRYGGFESKAYKSIMTLDRVTEPSWEVVDLEAGDIIYHRGYVSTNRMKQRLGDRFDESKTIFENMICNGMDRIWNCGHYVWTYKK